MSPARKLNPGVKLTDEPSVGVFARILTVLSVLAVFLAVPNVTWAQDDVAAAKKAYARGDKAFRAGKYPTALKAFEEGYQLSGKALFLLNIAHCRHLVNDAPGALESYRAFLGARQGRSLRLTELLRGQPNPPDPCV